MGKFQLQTRHSAVSAQLFMFVGLASSGQCDLMEHINIKSAHHICFCADVCIRLYLDLGFRLFKEDRQTCGVNISSDVRQK